MKWKTTAPPSANFLICL